MADIRLTESLPEAERLWKELSPNRTIFDDWDFRYCFYKYSPNPLRFYAAWENGQPAALMPLTLHPEYGLEFFAEDPCEENRVFCRPGSEHLIKPLYDNIGQRAQFYDISGEDQYTTSLEIEDYKYVLPLQGIGSFEDYLQKRLSAKRRRSLMKEMVALSVDRTETYVYSPEREEDINILFGYNINTFGQESYLLEKDQAAWRDLWRTFPDARMTALAIGGKKQAVSFSIIYNNEWHYLITGVNFKEYPGLGKLLVKANMEAAIEAGCRAFDAGLGDCGWKHLWHFDRQPQYQFTKFVD